MCGLSGVLTAQVSYPEENIFRDLFNISSLRGVEGSGVIVYQKGNYLTQPSVRTLKSKYISGILAYSGALDELLKPSCSAIIGHARWPTKGGTDEGALHPHRFGHICGVHNGTLHRVNGEDVKDQSDSAMLFKSFAENGVAETIAETRGAYALVWIDERDQTINFLRNAQRPLVFKNVGWDKNINTLYWASEPEQLDFIFKRSYKGNNAWDTYLPVDKWFKYPLKCGHIIRPVGVVDCAPKPLPVVTHSSHGSRGRWNGNRFVSVYGDDDDESWEAAFTHGYGGNTSDVTRLLPGPRRDADLPFTTRDIPAVEGGTSTMTKTQAKKIAKRMALEERKAARRREAAAVREAAEKSRPFRYIRPEDRFEGASSETEATETPATKGNMQEVVSALNQRTDDFPESMSFRPLSGRHCCSCGSEAQVGEKVFLANHDVGGRPDFICWECASTGAWTDITNGTSPTTVSP